MCICKAPHKGIGVRDYRDYICIYIYIYVCLYAGSIYIYIYRDREREREMESCHQDSQPGPTRMEKISSSEGSIVHLFAIAGWQIHWETRDVHKLTVSTVCSVAQIAKKIKINIKRYIYIYR